MMQGARHVRLDVDVFVTDRFSVFDEMFNSGI